MHAQRKMPEHSENFGSWGDASMVDKTKIQAIFQEHRLHYCMQFVTCLLVGFVHMNKG
jgi:hypothetical protein